MKHLIKTKKFLSGDSFVDTLLEPGKYVYLLNFKVSQKESIDISIRSNLNYFTDFLCDISFDLMYNAHIKYTKLIVLKRLKSEIRNFLDI